MEEIKNVEMIAEENTAIAVPEEKEGFAKKLWTKTKKALPIVGAFVVGFVAHALLPKKSLECDCDCCEVIEADDYTVEDAE